MSFRRGGTHQAPAFDRRTADPRLVAAMDAAGTRDPFAVATSPGASIVSPGLYSADVGRAVARAGGVRCEIEWPTGTPATEIVDAALGALRIAVERART